MDINDLTFEVCAELHKEMWTWVSEEAGRDKNHWPRWKDNGGNVPMVTHDCFACFVRGYGGWCSCCPLCDRQTVPGNEEDKGCLDGLYAQFEDEDTCLEEKAQIALQIANLPWTKKEGQLV